MLIIAAAAPQADVGTLNGLIALGTFLVTVVGGYVAFLIKRRVTTGNIATSDAGVLWDQAQKMRAELEAQRDKAMAQCDRLIESQTSHVLPVLSAIVESLRQITESLARLEKANEYPAIAGSLKQVTESLARLEKTNA